MRVSELMAKCRLSIYVESGAIRLLAFHQGHTTDWAVIATLTFTPQLEWLDSKRRAEVE